MFNPEASWNANSVISRSFISRTVDASKKTPVSVDLLRLGADDVFFNSLTHMEVLFLLTPTKKSTCHNHTGGDVLSQCESNCYHDDDFICIRKRGIVAIELTNLRESAR